jgi:hypothetical protein
LSLLTLNQLISSPDFITGKGFAYSTNKSNIDMNNTPNIRGYKVFNPDFTCKEMKFAVGETFEVSLPIEICKHGLHFCIKASHCFSYYPFDSNNIVCEVEARTPATGTPATGTPATGTPATGTPATGTPATGTPATGTPATGTPATGTPATGTPATVTPATGTPALFARVSRR